MAYNFNRPTPFPFSDYETANIWLLRSRDFARGQKSYRDISKNCALELFPFPYHNVLSVFLYDSLVCKFYHDRTVIHNPHRGGMTIDPTFTTKNRLNGILEAIGAKGFIFIQDKKLRYAPNGINEKSFEFRILTLTAENKASGKLIIEN